MAARSRRKGDSLHECAGESVANGKVAGGKDLKVASDLGVHARAVDDGMTGRYDELFENSADSTFLLCRHLVITMRIHHAGKEV